jgi:uncharacterized membrane protein
MYTTWEQQSAQQPEAQDFTAKAIPKSAQISSYGIVLLMFAASAWAWTAVPGDQMMAVHWNVYGQADGFAPKALALLILPVLMAVVTWFGWWSVQKEQYAENLEKSRPVAYASIFGALIVILGAHLSIIFTAMGYQVPVTALIMSAVGMLLAVIGALLAAGKTARHTSVGIRTPWTLKDDVVWSKTNRVGGIIMALTGVVTVFGALTNPIVAAIGLVSGIAVLLLATFSLSYYWSKKPTAS